MTIIELGHL